MTPHRAPLSSADTLSSAKALLGSGQAFCLCRFPGSEGPALFTSVTDTFGGGPTFTICGWSGSTAIHLYPFAGNEFLPEGPDLISQDFLAKAPLPEATTFVQYSTQFAAMQAAFAEKGIRKAILSRVKHVDKPKHFDPVAYFGILAQAYPKALVYLLAHETTGVWMGATPEVLLEGDGDTWHTHSLAGTLPANAHHHYTWGAKEMEEQELVSEHIRTTLREAGVDHWRETGPDTLQAGTVAHLLTRFDFGPPHQPEALLARLHPTPAVVGLPVDKARALIQRVEEHNRGLYTGYLGLTDFPERARLYVNLRCMQVGADVLALYVGGGLTAASELQREWDETEHKALTLTKLLNV